VLLIPNQIKRYSRCRDTAAADLFHCLMHKLDKHCSLKGRPVSCMLVSQCSTCLSRVCALHRRCNAACSTCSPCAHNSCNMYPAHHDVLQDLLHKPLHVFARSFLYIGCAHSGTGASAAAGKHTHATTFNETLTCLVQMSFWQVACCSRSTAPPSLHTTIITNN
jgi:hypothetical protein